MIKGNLISLINRPHDRHRVSERNPSTLSSQSVQPPSLFGSILYILPFHSSLRKVGILQTAGKCRASVFLSLLSRTSLSKIYHLCSMAVYTHLPKVRQGKCGMTGRSLTRLRNGTESRLSLPLWQENRRAMPFRRHAEREQKKSMSQRLQIAGITAAETEGRKSYVARGPQQRFC